MILKLISRNLKLYFRDKTSVFFSMLGVFIIILLYLTFLGDMMVSYAADEFSAYPNIDVGFMMDSWIMAGVIAVATITTTLGSYGVMVTDNTSKVVNDFRVSPIKRSVIVLAYIISSFIVGFLMSMAALAFAEFYILISGGQLLSFMALIKTLGVVALSVLMSSSIIFFIISLIKSNSAFGAVSTVVGSLIGFLMGVYIPIGNLPSGLQTVIKAFPFSHAAILLRQVMMSEAVDLSYVPDQFKLFVGVNFEVNDDLLSTFASIAYILISSIVFFGLGVLLISRKRKR